MDFERCADRPDKLTSALEALRFVTVIPIKVPLEVPVNVSSDVLAAYLLKHDEVGIQIGFRAWGKRVNRWDEIFNLAYDSL